MLSSTFSALILSAPRTARALALAIIAVFGLSGSSRAAQESIEEEIRRASSLLSTKPRAALAAFTKIERSHPGCLDCLLGIASARNLIGEFLGAEKSAREALELSDDSAVELMAWTAIGVSFYNRTPVDASSTLLRSNMTEAERAFRRVHELDGGKAEAFRFNLASALEWLGDEAAANALFSDPSMLNVAEPPDRREADSQPIPGTSGPIFVQGKVQRPVKVADVPLEYSDRARFQRIEGLVVLQSVVETDGTLTRVKVLKGLRGCTLPAIQAIRQWRFQPATLEGEPVAVYFTLTVKFALSR